MLPTNRAKILYSARKKAIAPRAIFSAMRSIRDVPAACLATQRDFHAVNARAMMPKAGMR
jgi:hypothetical protein